MRRTRSGAALGLTCAALVYWSGLAVAAEQRSVPETVAQPHDDAAQQAMMAMEYADAQGCFIIHGDEVRPVLPLLIASDGLGEVQHAQVIAALDAALARGCDIDQPDLLGLSPLNTAILQGNIALVSYLIEHGADPDLPIRSDSESIDGLNSRAFLAELAARAPEQEATWQRIAALLPAASQ